MTHNRTTHGMNKTPEHRVWCKIKHRCYNKNNQGYKNYGGRGIRVCKRWLESFEAFYEDMGDKPSDKHSIDRIDNDGDYTPDNCRWATKMEQMQNTRVAIKVKWKGEPLTLRQLSEKTGIKLRTLRDRYRKNNPLTSPLHQNQYDHKALSQVSDYPKAV